MPVVFGIFGKKLSIVRVVARMCRWRSVVCYSATVAAGAATSRHRRHRCRRYRQHIVNSPYSILRNRLFVKIHAADYEHVCLPR